MAEQLDLTLDDGRTLRAYDTVRDAPPGAFTVIWHHGSPQTGAPLSPLLIAAAERDIRLVSYARPGYGGSSPREARDVGSAADDVRALADAIGLTHFAVMGASGGGPHALACAALMPDRVSAAASLAGLAPFTSDGLDWYGGMASDGASLRAAERGEAERVAYEETAQFDPESFVAADYAALDARWSSLGADVQVSSAAGPGGLIADDVAFVSPWGFDPSHISSPVLLVHGRLDGVVPFSHSDWLLRHCPDAELWVRPRDGHISVLDASALAMDWLRHHS